MIEIKWIEHKMNKEILEEVDKRRIMNKMVTIKVDICQVTISSSP